LLLFFLLELNIHYGHLTLDKTSQSEIVVVVEDHGVMVSSAYNWKIIYSTKKQEYRIHCFLTSNVI